MSTNVTLRPAVAEALTAWPGAIPPILTGIAGWLARPGFAAEPMTVAYTRDLAGAYATTHIERQADRRTPARDKAALVVGLRGTILDLLPRILPDETCGAYAARITVPVDNRRAVAL
ncbi:hypothetical protein ACFWFX_16125 [Streptomyces roseolus]|uniref:hypothetical protein n=1 Tax=Streptomyces roseolus TaxID=67358 RepID=UPI0036534545